jgi:hypothetical protein
MSVRGKSPRLITLVASDKIFHLIKSSLLSEIAGFAVHHQSDSLYVIGRHVVVEARCLC